MIKPKDLLDDPLDTQVDYTFREHSHKFILEGYFGKKNKTIEEKVRCFLISIIFFN
jgi:hypothetical protein